jgi:hypothetical protein
MEREEVSVKWTAGLQARIMNLERAWRPAVQQDAPRPTAFWDRINDAKSEGMPRNGSEL